MRKRNAKEYKKQTGGDYKVAVKTTVKVKAKARAKYPKLSRLSGLLKEHGITLDQLRKQIGRAYSTVSKANNGHSLYDSFDMMNIQRVINEKSGQYYTLDDIFSINTAKTKRK